jgi:hypothetical protein
MVLSAEKKNVAIIKELEALRGELAEVEANITNYAIEIRQTYNIFAKYVKDPKLIGETEVLSKYPPYLSKRVSELRKVGEILYRIIALLRGEDIELEKERETLEADAKKYHQMLLKSLAEA